MSTVFKFRKGTTAQHATYIGKEREITIDSDKWTLVIHDGLTAGGHEVGKSNLLLAQTAQASAEAARDIALATEIRIVTEGDTQVARLQSEADKVTAEGDNQVARLIAQEAALISRTISTPLCDFADNLVVGTGTIGYAVSPALNGFKLTDVLVVAHTVGTDAGINIIRRRVGGNGTMLSSPVTLGANYQSSNGVMHPTNSELLTGDLLFVDVTSVGATAPKGVSVTLTFSPAAQE